MNITISMTPEELRAVWCVYTLLDPQTAVIQYIGCCKLTELFRLPDVQYNADFDEDKNYIISTTNICPDRLECKKLIVRVINRRGTPVMNRKTADTRLTAVRCVENGKIWKSAKECIEDCGISQSSLSNHLNRKRGYKTIHGLTYERVTHS